MHNELGLYSHDGKMYAVVEGDRISLGSAPSGEEGRLEDLASSSRGRDLCIYTRAINRGYNMLLSRGLADKVLAGIALGEGPVEAMERAGVLVASMGLEEHHGVCTSLGLTRGSCRLVLLDSLGQGRSIRARLFFRGNGSVWDKSYPAKMTLWSGPGYVAMETRTHHWLDEEFKVSRLHVLLKPRGPGDSVVEASILAHSTGLLSSMWLLLASQLLSTVEGYRLVADTARRASLRLMTGTTKTMRIDGEEYHEASPG
ncbi:MAG: hypothetical protein F7B18_02130, partial [Desulfurococcales archaeon]|nr:hypothetical protein [Desulfurococcales archaeon]